MNMTNRELDSWGSDFMDKFEKDVKAFDEDAWNEWDVDVLIGYLEENYTLTEEQQSWVEDYIEENE